MVANHVNDDGEATYSINWHLLESALARPTTSLMLLCNPHNPTGRCFSRATLERVASLCVAYDVTLCSDEVWGEMPLEPSTAPFTSALSLISPDSHIGAPAVAGLRERLIVLTSPSKCFNVATLNLALAVIPHEQLRLAFRSAGLDMAEVPPFGFFGAMAAYGSPESEAWRQRLVSYLKANRDYACHALASVKRLESNRKGLCFTRPESSYLLWVDADGLLPEGTNAAELLLARGVGVNDGATFGASARTFRVNFACRRETLTRGLDRIVAALR